MMDAQQRYVIWSEEHGGWWGKARRGYTRSLQEAGRYTKEEASAIVESANKYLPSSFHEVAFPDPEKGKNFQEGSKSKSQEKGDGESK